MTLIQAQLQEANVQRVVALIANAGFCVAADSHGYVVTEMPDAKPSRAKPMTTFKTWMATIKAAGEKAIPPGDPVFEYAHRVNLPIDILQLHWLEFRHRYIDNAKRYKDWRQVFRKSVEGNWFNLWILRDSGYTLSTAGRQARLNHGNGGDAEHA